MSTAEILNRKRFPRWLVGLMLVGSVFTGVACEGAVEGDVNTEDGGEGGGEGEGGVEGDVNLEGEGEGE